MSNRSKDAAALETAVLDLLSRAKNSPITRWRTAAEIAESLDNASGPRVRAALRRLQDRKLVERIGHARPAYAATARACGTAAPAPESRIVPRYSDSAKLHWYALPADATRGSLEDGTAEIRVIGADRVSRWVPLDPAL